MSNPGLEGVVRPFADQNTQPRGYFAFGEPSQPKVLVRIGFKGGTKTFSFSNSASQSTKMGQTHKESPPNNSESLQKKLTSIAGS